MSPRLPSRLLPPLPQELWDKISRHVSTFSIANSATVFGFKLDSNAQGHRAVWNKVFRDKKDVKEHWLQVATRLKTNPVLLGADLDLFYTKTSKPGKHARLLLLIDDQSGNIEYHHSSHLLPSLQPELKQVNHQVFQSNDLTIMILYFHPNGIYEKEDKYRFIFPTEPQGQLQTKYCFWEDSKRKLRSGRPRGIDGEISVAKDLTPAWFLNILYPGDKEPLQYHFQSYKRLDSVIHPISFKCTGSRNRYQLPVVDYYSFHWPEFMEVRSEVQDWTFFSAYPRRKFLACDTSEQGKRDRIEAMKGVR